MKTDKAIQSQLVIRKRFDVFLHIQTHIKRKNLGVIGSICNRSTESCINSIFQLFEERFFSRCLLLGKRAHAEYGKKCQNKKLFHLYCFSEYNTRKYVFENSRDKTHYRETDPKKCAISSVSADRYSQQVNPINPLIRCENPSKRITTNTTVRSKTSRKVIVTRTESDRTANGIQSDGGRKR